MDLTIDFETRSTVDIGAQGAFVYADHPLTDATCLSVVVDDEEPCYWMPEKFRRLIRSDYIPYQLIDEDVLLAYVKKATRIIAHNAQFEYLIWNRVLAPREGWPKIHVEKLYDTQAQCAYHALPLNLEQASAALNLPVQKDMRGHAVMLKLCKPRHPRKAEREVDTGWERHLYWHEDQEDYEALVRYCCQDVKTERLLFKTLAPLPDGERKVWRLNERINELGVPIDVESVRTITEALTRYEAELIHQFAQATEGSVATPRSYIELAKWVSVQLGRVVKSVDKDSTEQLLTEDLPDNVRTALKVKSEMGKSSTAKLKAMLNRMNAEGRVQGWSAYHAASTGRFAAWGLQLHNNPRDSYGPDDYDIVARLFGQDLRALPVFYSEPYFCASRCVRGSIAAPPGKEFICSDFSAIEGRGLVYLAGEKWVLDAYARGDDLYKHAAAMIFGISYDSVSKDQRQIGKVSELALGYGGGIGAYASMAKGYRIDLEQLPALILPTATQEELIGPYGAKALATIYLKKNFGAMSFEAAVACDIIKRRWRGDRPKVTQFWKELETCAVLAIQNSGEVFKYGRIMYVVHNEFLKCQLPSGRVLHYYKPRLQEGVDIDFGEKTSVSYMGMRIVEGKTTRQWVRLPTFGGKLAENVIQAFCRDILVSAMLRLDAASYKLVLHVHDEAMAEMDEGTGDLVEYNRIMEVVPPYATGMPIKAEGWVGKRYRK